MKKNPYLKETNCPLSELPCSQGEEVAWDCWSRVHGNFDPLASFADLCILECARERVAEMRAASMKFCAEGNAQAGIRAESPSQQGRSGVHG